MLFITDAHVQVHPPRTGGACRTTEVLCACCTGFEMGGWGEPWVPAAEPIIHTQEGA